MARARNIKPGFFSNDLLLELPFEYRILFAGLWMIADRAGRMLDRPKKIKIDIFPGDEVDCEAGLAALHRSGFIIRYAVDGVGYLQIKAWDKHQNPHVKEKASTIPAPCEHSACTVQAQEIPERAGLIPDSGFLIPDSGFLIPDCPELAPAQKAKVASKEKRKSRIPADFDLTTERITAAVDYWKTKNRNDLSATDEFEKFVAHHQGRGESMLDWDACWKTWYVNAIKFNRAPLVAVQGGMARQTGQARDFSKVDYSIGVDADGRF